MVERAEYSACLRPQSRNTEGKECQYSPLFLQKKEWLPWYSNDQNHGFKSHRVTGGGIVEEADDGPQPRRKIKGVSSRQWGR